MKNFIKLFFVVAVLTMSTETYSQIIGVKAGINLAKVDNNLTKNKLNPVSLIGVTAEFPIMDIFSFETGLLLSTKGYKTDYVIFTNQGESDAIYKCKANLSYFDIPLTIKASHKIGNLKINGFLGPYLGIGLVGIFSSKATINGEIETFTEINSGSYARDPSDTIAANDTKWDYGGFKRLDYGLTAGAGIEINAIQIGISYDFGLSNISRYNMKNRVLGIVVGYKFRGNKKR